TKELHLTFTSSVRAAGRAAASEGRGTGGALATIRVDFADPGRREPFARASGRLAAEALAHHGITSVHVGIAEPSVTRTPTAESALRELTGEEVLDGVALGDGIGRAEVEAALPSIEAAFAPALAEASSKSAVYDLAYALVAEDRVASHSRPTV